MKLVGLYKENTIKYFLYQDSGRTVDEYTVLFPKFEKIN